MHFDKCNKLRNLLFTKGKKHYLRHVSFFTLLCKQKLNPVLRLKLYIFDATRFVKM
jgi:hypothetical protein